MTEAPLRDERHHPPLILLCGLLCDEDIWADVIPCLELSCRALAVSFPNLSSIEAMAEHVLALAPPRFALAGHSMGGRVALEVYRRAPARVLGLALLNTGVHATRPNEASSRGQLVEIARTRGLAALAAAWLPPLLFEHQTAADPLFQRLARMVERNTAESFAAQIRALLERPDAEPVLASVRVPALLLGATGDSWSPPRQHAAMRDLAPAAKLTILDRAGHMSPAESPDAVASALSEWLARVVEHSEERPNAVERLLIAEQCEQQIYKYARLNDLGSWTALSLLFTESGLFYRPSHPDAAVSGRAAILASFTARPARLSRHVVTNVEVFVESARRARAVSTLVLLASESESSPLTSMAIGHFHDELLRVGDEWLFAERRGSITMRSAAVTREAGK